MDSSIVQDFDPDMEQDNIDIISRQTTYDRDTIIDKLKIHNNNIDDVIREYMSPNKKTTLPVDKKQKTTNQIIFSEIRKLMDEACLSYQRKKEGAEQKKS